MVCLLSRSPSSSCPGICSSHHSLMIQHSFILPPYPTCLPMLRSCEWVVGAVGLARLNAPAASAAADGIVARPFELRLPHFSVLVSLTA